MKLLNKKFEIVLILLFFLFSWWLMNKSFGYDPVSHQFRIARHQVGDFGLHLSLIRSFSWGDNFPAESPFFPGKPLPYHYYFDFLVGLLERAGVRIDYAFNGLSIIAFTALLYLIYRLPQLIFGKSIVLGLLAVVLFLTSPSLTFLSFLKEKGLSLKLWHELWLLPDYLHKGPFDGSLTSLFFTLNPYLNQRHLIAAMAVGLLLIYVVYQRLKEKKEFSVIGLVLIGLVLGLTARLHTLLFFSTGLTLLLLLLFNRRFKYLLPLFLPAGLLAVFQLRVVLQQGLSHPWWNPGFHAEKPLTLFSFGKYWLFNLGAAVFTIPLGVCLAKQKQRKLFLSVLPLFIIANLFQLGFRIDHNHSLFNFFFIFGNFYSAYFLWSLWQRSVLVKGVVPLLLFLLTTSGVINLMALKNDFQFPLKDAPADKFIQWIKENTHKRDVFLAREEILDPLTLAGRRNYFGHRYYLEVMGYNFSQREKLAKDFFEASSGETLSIMRKEGIKYLVISLKRVADFNYKVNIFFLQENLKRVYEDRDVFVFKL